jgi:hypothetical protein
LIGGVIEVQLSHELCLNGDLTSDVFLSLIWALLIFLPLDLSGLAGPTSFEVFEVVDSDSARPVSVGMDEVAFS